MLWLNYLLGWFLRPLSSVVLLWVFAFSQIANAQTPSVSEQCSNFAKSADPGATGSVRNIGQIFESDGYRINWTCDVTYPDSTVWRDANIFYSKQCNSSMHQSQNISQPYAKDNCTCISPSYISYDLSTDSFQCAGCPAGLHAVDGVCVNSKEPDNCPNGDYSGNSYDGDCGHPPDNCPEGDLSGSSTDGSCDCPAGKEKVGSSCQDPCPNGKHRNQETGACDDNCTNGMVWNGSACGCPQGSYYGQVNGQDSCIAGSGNDGSGSGDTSGGSSGSGDGGTSSGGSGGSGSGGSGSGGSGTGGSGTGSSGSGDSGGSSSGGDASGGTGGSGTGSGGNDSCASGLVISGICCVSGMTNADGSCYINDGAPPSNNTDLSGITSRLDTLINKIPSSLPSKTPGSFPTTSDDAQIASLKSDIHAQFVLIKTSIGQMFNASSSLSGAGSLPCYRNLSLFAGKTFSICFSDYEDELAIIPLFIYGMGFILAVSIVLSGKKND